MKKKKIGIVTLTACWGCSFEFLNLKGYLIKLFKEFEIGYFNLLKNASLENKSFEILFIEGAVSTKKEEKMLKELREKTKFLVALGSCATNGNILFLRNFIPHSELEKIYLNKKLGIREETELKPIDRVVKIDFSLPGCPFSKIELIEFLKEIRYGRLPQEKNYPVCMKCKRRGKNCLLSQGILCLGPLIRGGCNAVCPLNNFPCWGCRGLREDANIESFIKRISKRLNISENEIVEKLELYNLR